MLYQIYIYQCDVDGCNEQIENKTVLWYYSRPPEPCPPDGWTKIGYKLYCDKHQIQLVIDNEVQVIL